MLNFQPYYCPSEIFLVSEVAHEKSGSGFHFICIPHLIAFTGFEPESDLISLFAVSGAILTSRRRHGVGRVRPARFGEGVLQNLDGAANDRGVSGRLCSTIPDTRPRFDLRTRFSAAGSWNADRRSDHRPSFALAKRVCFTLHLLGTFRNECHHSIALAKVHAGAKYQR